MLSIQKNIIDGRKNNSFDERGRLLDEKRCAEEVKTSPNLSKGEEQPTALAFRRHRFLSEFPKVVSKDIKPMR
jgi:hypothetical protein